MGWFKNWIFILFLTFISIVSLPNPSFFSKKIKTFFALCESARSSFSLIDRCLAAGDSVQFPEMAVKDGQDPRIAKGPAEF